MEGHLYNRSRIRNSRSLNYRCGNDLRTDASHDVGFCSSHSLVVYLSRANSDVVCFSAIFRDVVRFSSADSDVVRLCGILRNVISLCVGDIICYRFSWAN